MLVSRLKRFYSATGEQLHPTVTRKQLRVRATHSSAHVTNWPVRELVDKFLLTPQMEWLTKVHKPMEFDKWVHRYPGGVRPNSAQR